MKQLKHCISVWGVALLLTVLFVGTGCSSMNAGCLLEDKGVVVLTESAVQILECEDPDAVRTDIKKAVDKLGLCDDMQTGPWADRLCPGISNEVTKLITEKGIPANWKCKAVNAKDKLKAALETACKKIPVKQPLVCK